MCLVRGVLALVHCWQSTSACLACRRVGCVVRQGWTAPGHSARTATFRCFSCRPPRKMRCPPGGVVFPHPPVLCRSFPSLPLLLLLSWVIHLGGRAWTQAWLAEFSLPRRCGRRADAAVEGHRRPAGRECWPRSSLPPSCRLPAARGGLLLGSRFDTHPGGVFARASASLVKAVCTCTI